MYIPEMTNEQAQTIARASVAYMYAMELDVRGDQMDAYGSEQTTFEKMECLRDLLQAVAPVIRRMNNPSKE